MPSSAGFRRQRSHSTGARTGSTGCAAARSAISNSRWISSSGVRSPRGGCRRGANRASPRRNAPGVNACVRPRFVISVATSSRHVCRDDARRGAKPRPATGGHRRGCRFARPLVGDRSGVPVVPRPLGGGVPDSAGRPIRRITAVVADAAPCDAPESQSVGPPERKSHDGQVNQIHILYWGAAPVLMGGNPLDCRLSGQRIAHVVCSTHIRDQVYWSRIVQFRPRDSCSGLALAASAAWATTTAFKTSGLATTTAA